MVGGTDKDKTKEVPSFHPAFGVSSIKNHVAIVLDMDNVPYPLWSELFLNTATAFEVDDHLIDPLSDSPARPVVDKTLWKRLDAIVKQWLYATISTDILKTVVKAGSTAKDTWTRIKDLFEDNKHSRAVFLEQQFSATTQKNFQNISAYCQALKTIADQLSNIGAKVTNDRLVLQLVTGLSDGFSNIATLIQQSDPLPAFSKARSTLVLEETRQSNAALSSRGIALTVTHSDTPDSGDLSDTPPPAPAFVYKNRVFLGRGRGNNRHRYNRGRSTGRRSGRPSGTNQSSGGHGADTRRQPQQSSMGQWAWIPYGSATPHASWTPPPCPCPTAGWAPQSHSSPGILGPRPQQGFLAQQPTGNAPSPQTYYPTDLAAAMQTMTLQSPDDSGYMDMGASSHMTSDQGKLTSYFNLSTNSCITVGNGHTIPIRGCGHTHVTRPLPPLILNHVLHAPGLVKNLVSVRKFTTDNAVSVEFEPLGITMKDLQTGTRLMRCNSRGDLYPLSPFAAPKSSIALSAVAPSLWHSRLGHPGPPVLSILRNSNSIQCNKIPNTKHCHACELGKYTKLPFIPSTSRTLLPFDIIHSDLWTSPVLCTLGQRYYLLFLDDFTNFLWTFPITNKSNVFSIFKQFYTLIHTQFERSIKTFQCDNGKEFDNNSYHTFFKSTGTQFRFSCPHTSSQNGKAERKIRTINDTIRTLLAHSHVPPNLWPYALSMATYIHNILPSKANRYISPTQSLYLRLPSYSNLRVFGCLCYPHLPSVSINKLDAQSIPCAFLGYPPNHRGYLCLDLSTRKIIVSRHVTFHETVFPFQQLHKPTPSTYTFLDSDLPPTLQQHRSQLHPTPSPATSHIRPQRPLSFMFTQDDPALNLLTTPSHPH
ncbi:hypothetical protein vseg_013451 [Gypsophila vaccaria]